MQYHYQLSSDGDNILAMKMETEDTVTLTLAEAERLLDYDPGTGVFRWRADRAIRGARAGQEVGIVKTSRRNIMYRAVRLGRVYVQLARIAWLLQYGEWPVGNVLYADGNSLNLRIDNLRLARFPRVVDPDGKRRTSPEAHRHAQLRRDFGMTADDYDGMLAAQGGVCAICSRPETRLYKGRVQMMCVDHDHDTGEIRSLLCHKCNVVLGMSGDSAKMLRRAADYLDRHKTKRRVA